MRAEVIPRRGPCLSVLRSGTLYIVLLLIHLDVSNCHQLEISPATFHRHRRFSRGPQTARLEEELTTAIPGRGAIWPSSPDSYNLRQVGIVPWRKAIIVNNRIRSGVRVGSIKMAGRGAAAGGESRCGGLEQVESWAAGSTILAN
ncbi:hypothetical protein J6590_012523 [Homalodisca vitripennis]|nr:hypothetical protein J6590_012523 [Homalodisca vitripennis]